MVQEWQCSTGLRIVWCWKCLRQQLLFSVLSTSIVRDHFSLHSWEPQQTKPYKYSKPKPFGPVFVYKNTIYLYTYTFEYSIFVYTTTHGVFCLLEYKNNYVYRKWLIHYIPRTLTLLQLVTLFSEQEMKRIGDWKTIYVYPSFERFGLAEHLLLL